MKVSDITPTPHEWERLNSQSAGGVESWTKTNAPSIQRLLSAPTEAEAPALKTLQKLTETELAATLIGEPASLSWSPEHTWTTVNAFIHCKRIRIPDEARDVLSRIHMALPPPNDLDITTAWIERIEDVLPAGDSRLKAKQAIASTPGLLEILAKDPEAKSEELSRVLRHLEWWQTIRLNLMSAWFSEPSEHWDSLVAGEIAIGYQCPREVLQHPALPRGDARRAIRNYFLQNRPFPRRLICLVSIVAGTDPSMLTDILGPGVRAVRIPEVTARFMKEVQREEGVPDEWARLIRRYPAHAKDVALTWVDADAHPINLDASAAAELMTQATSREERRSLIEALPTWNISAREANALRG